MDLHTHLAYEQQIRNLQLLESRLHRRREKDLAELRQAQSDRRNRDTNNHEAAARLLNEAKRARIFQPAIARARFSHSAQSPIQRWLRISLGKRTGRLV